MLRALKGRRLILTLKAVLPLIGYLFFGIANVVSLTHAMKSLAPSMVYAMWTGLVIFFSAVMDAGTGRMRLSLKRVFFLTLVMGGTVGLNLISRGE
jgi:quaternary ammonium compound-resistance protein SugE